MATLEDLLCEFTADPGDCCDICASELPPGSPVYFVSDGGWDAREGTYLCRACAEAYLRGESLARVRKG